jgi:hypothetical protein
MRPIFLSKLALFTAQRPSLSGARPEKEKREKREIFRNAFV